MKDKKLVLVKSSWVGIDFAMYISEENICRVQEAIKATRDNPSAEVPPNVSWLGYVKSMLDSEGIEYELVYFVGI